MRLDVPWPFPEASPRHRRDSRIRPPMAKTAWWSFRLRVVCSSPPVPGAAKTKGTLDHVLFGSRAPKNTTFSATGYTVREKRHFGFDNLYILDGWHDMIMT